MGKIINGVASEFEIPNEPQVITHWIDPTIEEQRKIINRIEEIIYNEKISNVEARLMIKDIIEGKVKL